MRSVCNAFRMRRVIEQRVRKRQSERQSARSVGIKAPARAPNLRPPRRRLLKEIVKEVMHLDVQLTDVAAVATVVFIVGMSVASSILRVGVSLVCRIPDARALVADSVISRLLSRFADLS